MGGEGGGGGGVDCALRRNHQGFPTCRKIKSVRRTKMSKNSCVRSLGGDERRLLEQKQVVDPGGGRCNYSPWTTSVRSVL